MRSRLAVSRLVAASSRVVGPRRARRLLATREHDYEYSSEKEKRRSETAEKFNFHILLGHKAFHNKQWDEALKEYKLAFKYHREHTPLSAMAAVYYERGQYTSAVEAANLAIKVARSHDADPGVIAREKLRIGKSWERLGKAELAQQALMEASMDTNDHQEIFSHLHQLDHQMGTTMSTRQFTEADLAQQQPYLKVLTAKVPVSVRLLPERGRALIAEKKFEVGEAIFSEAPLVSYVDFQNTEERYCAATLQPLQEPSLNFATKEAEDIFSSMTEDQREAMRGQLLELLNVPKLDVRRCDKCGETFQFANAEAEQFARDTFLGPLCRGDCANDKELQALLPSQLQKGYRGVADDMVLPKHHDTASLEMLTMLCARLASDLDLWERFARFMVFAERSPQRLLMEHEAAHLKLLQSRFPSLDWLLTDRNFLRLKSMVNLNTFSIVTRGVDFALSSNAITSLREGQNADGSEMELKMEMNDHAVRGSVLYQLGSFMNHNCDPNVERSSPSLTSRVTWIASKPIERGDELTIAYVALEDANNDQGRRRQMLADQYGFVCNCEVCLKAEAAAALGEEAHLTGDKNTFEEE